MFSFVSQLICGFPDDGEALGNHVDGSCACSVLGGKVVSLPLMPTSKHVAEAVNVMGSRGLASVESRPWHVYTNRYVYTWI